MYTRSKTYGLAQYYFRLRPMIDYTDKHHARKDKLHVGNEASTAMQHRRINALRQLDVRVQSLATTVQVKPCVVATSTSAAFGEGVALETMIPSLRARPNALDAHRFCNATRLLQIKNVHTVGLGIGVHIHVSTCGEVYIILPGEESKLRVGDAEMHGTLLRQQKERGIRTCRRQLGTEYVDWGD